jgi:hypothetical protein
MLTWEISKIEITDFIWISQAFLEDDTVLLDMEVFDLKIRASIAADVFF